MKDEKGFTLIEIVVAVAIMAIIGIILSFIISIASNYYVNSENLKTESDQNYKAVLDESDSSNSKPATLSFTANANEKQIPVTITVSDSKQKPDSDSKQEPDSDSKKPNSDLKQKDTTADDVNIDYLSFVNTKPVASLNGTPVTDTVTDRLKFRNTVVGEGNNKGAWNKNNAGTYKEGDFVTYQDRTYLLVMDKNQQDNLGNYYPPGGPEVSGWQLMDAYIPSGSIFTYYLKGDIYLNNGHAYRCNTAMASNDISPDIEDVGTYNAQGINFYQTPKAQNAKKQWESNGYYLNGHWTNNDIAQ